MNAPLDVVRLDAIADRKGIAGYGLFGQRGDGPLIEPVLLRNIDDEPLKICRGAVLQPLPRNLFRFSVEARMAQRFCEERWGNQGGRERTRDDYRVFFGRLAFSRRLINHCVRRALAEAHADSLAICRRYSVVHRHGAYLFCSHLGERARQLAVAFPLAVPTILNSPKQKEAIAATLAGAKLRTIAEIIELPYSARHLPASVSNCIGLNALQALSPETLHLAPRTSRSARFWAHIVDRIHFGHYDFDKADFINWMTRRWGEMRPLGLGGAYYLADWASSVARGTELQRLRVLAERENINLERLFPSATFYHGPVATEAKPFNSKMHIRAAQAAARDWHKEILRARLTTNHPLPEPFIPRGQVGEITISPLTTTDELIEEGDAMRHCVASYADRALVADCWLYSVRRNGERVATLELRRGSNYKSFVVAQLKGPENEPVSKEIASAALKWLREAKPTRPSPTITELDDEIPF